MPGDALLPFDTLPESADQEELEAWTRQLLGDLHDRWLAVYREGGAFPRANVSGETMSVAGTLMLRLADMAISTVMARDPMEPEAKARGDTGLLMARVAGYAVRSIEPRVKAVILPVMEREVRSCAGAAPRPTDDASPDQVAAPADLPMTPIATPACNITLVADGCYDLPAHRAADHFATYWQPSPESKAAIAAGLPIKVMLWANQHPPIRLEVECL